MSDDETKRPEDPDRAAILARRQHFIAIALSGLATTTACASTGEGDKTTGDKAKGAQPEAPPEPCLKVKAPPETSETDGAEAAPQPCLKVAPPDPEAETGDTGDESGKPAEPPPEPCLKVAPRPCLKKAAPKPCLNVPPPSE
jgi:hypothetical protein